MGRLGQSNIHNRGVARGGKNRHPSRNLADQLTLFKSEGTDNVPHTTASPPGFKKLGIYTSANTTIGATTGQKMHSK